MCGIFGYVGKEQEIDPNVIRDTLAHRGPDDFGYHSERYREQRVFISHNRLSIIGLGGQGKQPFFSEDKKIILSYNGEIYNYREIREQLKASGVLFQTETDTEVLLKAYEAWGLTKLLSAINGIFAFIIVDLRCSKVLAVRDHFGVKPLYYFFDGDRLVLSSEIKAMFQVKGIPKLINRDVLGEFIANMWVYEPDTLFKGIFKLCSGHFLEYDLASKHMTVKQYWDIMDAEPSANCLDEHIERVVQEQLVSDVPVGLYLSGGIDSVIVTHNAAKAQKNLLALNLCNQNSSRHNEYNNIPRLQALHALNVRSFQPDASMVDIYRRMIYHLDEPIADPAVIPSYLLAEEARRQQVKVMLSGMGGDEIFAGYNRIRFLEHRNVLNPMRSFLPLLAKVPFASNLLKREAMRAYDFLCDQSPENYFSLMYYFNRPTVSSLVKGDEWFDRYREKIRGFLRGKTFSDDMQKFQYLDLKGFLSSHNLLYVDKTSMAASVEVRVPLLDRRFASAFFRIPTSQKLEMGTKTPLRQYVERHLGHDFTKHRKQGFSFPVNDWMKSYLRNDVEDLLGREEIGGLLDAKALRMIVNNHLRRKEDATWKIWTLYTLDLWLQMFTPGA